MTPSVRSPRIFRAACAVGIGLADMRAVAAVFRREVRAVVDDKGNVARLHNRAKADDGFFQFVRADVF